MITWKRGGLTFAVALAAALVGAFAASMSDPAPADGADDAACGPIVHKSVGSVQYCPLWMPARGYIPVHQFAADGTPIEKGRLDYAGSVNWFVCETRYPDGRFPGNYSDPAHPYVNDWWAKTLSDDGVWGWTNEVYFSGGEDNEPDAGLRSCEGGSQAPPTTNAGDETSPQSLAGGNCPVTVEDQRVTLEVSARESWQNSWFNQSSGTITHGDEYDVEDFDGGTIELSAATCKTPEGEWRVILPIHAAANYNGIELAGLTGDRAVGAMITGYDTSSSESDSYEKARLEVEAFDCAERNQWKVFNAIATFPIPGVSYAVDLAQWFAGTFVLPEDEAECQTLGKMSVAIAVLDSVTTCKKKADGKKAEGKKRPLCRKAWRPAMRWQRQKARWAKPLAARMGAGSIMIRTSEETFTEEFQETPGAGSTPITREHRMDFRIGY